MSDPRISDAASLYQRISGLDAGQGGAEKKDVDFSALVGQSIGDSISQIKKAEDITAAGLIGQVSLEEMTAAINNAETTLRTVVAVRDRVITAYQEIIKMPI